jgi:hypothetical protein
MTTLAAASLSVREAAELLGRDRTRVYALLRSDLVSSLLRSGWFGGEWARWACVTPSRRVSSIDSF